MRLGGGFYPKFLPMPPGQVRCRRYSSSGDVFCFECGDSSEAPGYCMRCWLLDDEMNVLEEVPAPPAPLTIAVETFGVGRNEEDGKPTQYFRRIASDERLAALRSMPYSDYLQTPEWRLVRECALDAAGRRCQVCNTGDGLEVHHRAYERRGREVLEDVTVLCRECHGQFHARGKLAPAAETPPPIRRIRMVFPEQMTPEMERFCADW